MNRKKFFFSTFLTALLIQAPAFAAPPVSEILSNIQKAKPGDEIVIPNGVYKDFPLRVKVSGVEGKPIVIRAETSGQVFMTGGSYLFLEGSDLVIAGLVYKDGGITVDKGHVMTVRGDRSRITECAVVDFNAANQGKQWIRFFGTRHRFDHNWVEGKTTMDPELQIEVDEKSPNDILIDHNYFGPRPPLPDNANGGETIRIGYSSQAYWTSRTRVEDNLFEECDGDAEVISSKSCENYFRRNTFFRCAGTLTLRHGERNVVEGNFFLGDKKKETGGVRVIGGGHRIVGNTFIGTEGRMGGAIAVTCAQPDFKPSGYWTVTNVLIAFNTLIDNGVSGIALASMNGGKGGSQTVLPERIQVASNVIVARKGFPAFTGPLGKNIDFSGNYFQGETIGLEKPDGVTRTDLPVKNAGAEAFPMGDSQLRPLKRADVGPSWMKKT